VPELPEVETMVRGIRPHVVGQRIASVRRCRCSRKPITLRPSFPTLSRRIRGQTVTSVRRLAKRVVLELSSTDSLVIEPRMTGLVLLADPPTTQHLRLEWRFDGAGPHSAMRFWDRRGLGTVTLLRRSEMEEQLGPHRLGPDALSLSLPDWRDRCRRTNRLLKVALLDQKWIAGIGNLYASEILHAAKIPPTTRTRDLSRNGIEWLAEATRTVLHEAIEYEGSTLGDQTYRNVLNRNGRYQSRHRVYGRAGLPCGTCREAIVVRLVQAQRSTFFCPHCQRRS